MSEELKPCPFCGGKAEGMPRFCIGYIGDGVKCSVCGAETPSHLTDENAARRWNARHLTPKQQCADEMYDALELMIRYCNALEEKLLSNQISVTDIFLDSPHEPVPEDVAECALAKARGEA